MELSYKHTLRISQVLWLYASLWIVQCQENMAPVWEETLQQTLNVEGISENTPTGTVIGSLRARDPEGGAVQYRAGDSDTFAVDEDSGRVTLIYQLDRESTTQIQATFFATDTQGNQATAEYTVTVLDYNDNKPVFLNVPYAARVTEESSVGVEVFNGISVTDADRGSNAVITLSCYVPPNDMEDLDMQQAQDACEHFEVVEQQEGEGRYSGVVNIKADIDYETTKSFIMTILAEDEGAIALNSTINLVIEVIDIQDSPPQFMNTPLSLFVDENTPNGTVVGEIVARDQDIGSPNPLSINIIQDLKNWFSLDEATESDGVYTSVIRAKEGIDRESISGMYSFIVEAREIISGQISDIKTQTTVTVTLRDKNDNPPMFDQSVYNVTVPEGLLYGAQIPGLNMIVSDPDSGNNAYFQVSIEVEDDPVFDTPQNEVYILTPGSGTGSAAIALTVGNPLYVDHESRYANTQTLKIIAKETETSEQKSSMATVNLFIQDLNDHTPKFSGTEYSASVREDRPNGTLVTTITAEDLDSGAFGQITYSLLGDNSYLFSINRTTGAITIAETLDHETLNQISLVVKATDGGGQSAQVPFTVTVLDYNDQGPVFDVDQYDTFVPESSTILDPNVTVHATDLDSDNLVTYRIVGGNTPDGAFRVDGTTGHVFLTRPVGYQETPDTRGYFELLIEGSDNGRPPQTAEVAVVVTVRDENDNAPVFWRDTYFGNVSEITPPGTSVTTVNATDMDAGRNAELGYILHSGSKDKFVVDYNSGVVAVAERADLDIEEFGDRYSMTVYAVDQGSPPQTGTALVFITVSDINNKQPDFGQDNYFVSISDDHPVGNNVIQVSAVDQDSSASLTYNIDPDSYEARDPNGNPVTSTNLFNFRDAFTINNSTGQITSTREMNRNAVARVTFTVNVDDVNGEQPVDQSDTATVEVSITRSGDTTDPVFPDESPEFRISVPENEPSGTVITQITAFDPRNNQPITDFREVPGTDPNDYFTVDRTTGRVSLNERFDYETMPTKQLSFQVRAYTSDPEPREAVATVYVTVQDRNDNSPEFRRGQYTFRVSEDTTYPRDIGFVIAEDKDSGNFGQFRYSISGQLAETFEIDPVNGNVRVAPNKTLDRETIPEYNLLVTAEDNPGGAEVLRTSLLLEIIVEDVNDNLPVFTSNPYEMQAFETYGPQTSLGKVTARDDDAGLNGILRYTIESGNDKNLFNLDPQTGIIWTSTSMEGNAREAPYVLTIKAQDGGSPATTSTTSVNIYVRDFQINDGNPKFIYPEDDGVVINMPEEPEPGTNVTQIIAIDRDEGLAGQVVYGFLANENLPDHDKFHIDPNTGVITVVGPLDRENKQVYELILVVRDQGNPPKVTQRIIYVNLTDIDDNTASFSDCSTAPVADPQIAKVLEGKPSGEYITTVEACDKDSYPNNNVYYFITCGNEASTNNGDQPPFRIDVEEGRIYTNVVLDREYKSQYTICVTATSSRYLNVTIEETIEARRKRQADGDDDGEEQGPTNMIQVVIIVEDVDDNGPDFSAVLGADGKIVTGVLAGAKIGTDVITVYADDADVTSDFTYTLSQIQYNGPRDIETIEAFEIDPNTGAVRTNLVEYRDYTEGYFQMVVTARDSQARTAKADLFIYVALETQRLRFTFNGAPEVANDWYKPFIAGMEEILSSGTEINPDTLSYHFMEDGNYDFQKSDVCFHMIKDNKVLNPDVGIKLIEDTDDSKRGELYRRWSVLSVDRCVTYTTRYWSGYWWLWWILIALAILIFIIALILICCICYCWKKYQKHPYVGKSYVILDPVEVVSKPPMSDIEYQEEYITVN